MKINSQVLCGFTGDPILVDSARPGDAPKIRPEYKELTLKDACLQACSAAAPDDDKLGPLGKYEAGMIGAAIAKGMDITLKQASTLKDRVEKVFLSPEWVWSIHEALEALGSAPAAKDTKK